MGEGEHLVKEEGEDESLLNISCNKYRVDQVLNNSYLRFEEIKLFPSLLSFRILKAEK